MTEEVHLGWWIASFSVGWLSLGVAYLIIVAMRHREKQRRPANGPSPVYIQRVSVASDLTPLIGGLEKEGIPFRDSQLWIFGSDGRYVVKNKGKRWRKALSDWSAKGLRVKYILLDADEEVRNELRTLRASMSGPFEAVCLAEGAAPDVARELETCHPTLFIGPDGNKAAWIERLHPRDSAYAYDVKYVSPKAMMAERECAEFESYKHKLELMMDSSVPVVEDAPGA